MDIITKITNRCNLRCGYCYHQIICKKRCESTSDDLTVSTAERLFEMLRELAEKRSFKSFGFIWHGGEPTLVKTTLFGAILDAQARILNRVHRTNTIQSNLSVALDDAYARFLVKWRLLIGLSYDVINTARDPKNIHKATIVRNLGRLDRHGIRPGAIAVISRYNVDFPKFLFDFFYDRGMEVCFNRVVPFDPQTRSVAISLSEYTNFMRSIFGLWKARGFRGCKIGNFLYMARKIAQPDWRSLCSYEEVCANYHINVALSGDVSPCDNLADRSDMIYGNIFDPRFSLADIFHSKVMRRFKKRSAMLKLKCSGCPIHGACQGGCPSEAVRLRGSFYERTDQCDYYRTAFSMIKPHVKRILKSAGAG